MVAPPSCPGLNVDILVDGQPLQEYNDIGEGPVPPNTATKYIEARSDVPFAVRVTINEDFPFPTGDIGVTTTLDGTLDEARCIEAREIFDPQGAVINGQAVEIGNSAHALRMFRFSALDIDENDSSQIEEHIRRELEAVGTIVVRLQFIKNIGRNVPGRKYEDVKKIGQLPERALKGQSKSHQASLDQPILAHGNWYECDLIGSAPFVTVQFIYRSLDALRALHIVPREPTPLPLEERPEQDLSADELLQLVRQFKARDAVALKVKKEANVKREWSDPTATVGDDGLVILGALGRKRRRGKDNEVIVLD